MIRVLLGLVGFLHAANVYAVWDRYSPFEPGQGLRPFPLTELVDVSPSSGMPDARHDEFMERGRPGVSLGISWASNGSVSVALVKNGEKVFSGPLSGVASPAAGSSVYTADLNADGVPDYVLFTYSGGCGLAAQMTWGTFLLSSPAGYKSTCLLSYDMKPTDCVDIDGRAHWVRSSFISGEEGKDGRRHNYWVYNLLGFAEGALVSANDRDRRFPKWVLYSFGPNHRETDQLTDEQRRRLWLKAVELDRCMPKGD